MPHLVILYTPQLDTETDIDTLCRKLCDRMLGIVAEDGTQVFPTGGTRVLAYPAAHHAVADDGTVGRAAGGSGDYAFMWLNLRMGKGRSAAVHQAVGDALLQCTQDHLAPVFAKRHIGVTIQIDEGSEVFNAKHSNLHPLFT
jgi:5-carboxymethyl-2-hydroxymuconate isomerase